MNGGTRDPGEPIDAFAAAQSPERRASVRLGSKAGHDKRSQILRRDYADPDALRRLAARIKQHTLDHLDLYLERATERLESHGAVVHFASDAQAARELVLEILRGIGAERTVKTKSMVTEEIELAPYLEERGIECVETDLGEFIVQIDADRPSHIVKPILHKNRAEIARSFERHALGAYDDTPEVITRRARAFLRQKYLAADAGITGANFVSAESGRLVLVTNEGNSRFCLAAPRCSISLVGIEKIVPRDRDLAVLLNLLARSATGQPLSVYTEFIAGPKPASRPDGPEQMHVIFIDNGRSALLGGDTREILRCIRCGACQNVCPVYRQASGHAYRSVYAGPIGAVLTPALAAATSTGGFAALGDLPRASSLCGACNEVCPVDIPIPDLLLRLRDRVKREAPSPQAATSMTGWAAVASRPWAWKRALAAGGVALRLPEALRPRSLRVWNENHALPAWRGGAFRQWFAARRSAP
jgi:L-lactate dehydrogenase complex protein LldF